MIDGLIGGTLHGKPERRTGKSGKAFFTAKLRTPATNGDALFVNVIAFSASLGDLLAALDDGDSVSMAGTLTPRAWNNRSGEARPALDMVLHGLLTAYHVTRKRQAVRPDSQRNEPAEDFPPDGMP